jgi:crotonobetainyl-CoA:carnitine CoA-transferase CaiB-like acyl-CoA transferase
MPGVFNGVRILDFTQGTAGPFAGMLLAEQGADVVKVEPPAGDRSRGQPVFHAVNRSKRGIILDLSSQAGREKAHALVKGADVVLVDGLQQDAGDLDIDYASLAPLNARLVYCSIPMYGSKGPLAGLPPDDNMVAAVSCIYGNQFSYSGSPVFYVTPFVAYATAVLVAAAVSSALYERARTGRGDFVEVSGLSGAFAISAPGFVKLLTMEVTRLSELNPDPKGASPAYRVYRAADGEWLMLGALTPAFMVKVLMTVGAQDLLADPRFEGFPFAVPKDDGLQEVARRLGEAFASRPRREWLDALKEADIPAGPVATRDEWLNEPQVIQNGMRVEVDDPEIGRSTQVGIPLTLHGAPGAIRGPAPLLGQHNSECEGLWRSPETQAFGSNTPRRHPLEGIKVLDLGTTYAGPFSCMLLADLGADVTKVESLGGDPFRTLGAAFIGVNRGKRALAIDLKQDEGLQTFYDMVRQTDIVAGNFRSGVTKRLKIDYETLSAVNPRVICCSITPYGATGPLSDLPGYDPVIGARSGMQRAQGGYGEDDEPVYHNTAIIDFTTALMAAYGMCAALLHREKTGRGQLVETCLANNATVAQVAEFLRYEGRPPVLAGARDIQGTSAAYRIYRCGEGRWLFLGATTAEQADAILALSPGIPAAGGAELLNSSWDGAAAIALESFFAGRARNEVLERLTKNGVPCCPCLTLEELFTDPHLEANDLWWRSEEGLLGPFQQIGAIVKWREHSMRLERPAPPFAQHSREVLQEYGIDSSRIDALVKNGVVLTPEQAPVIEPLETATGQGRDPEGDGRA